MSAAGARSATTSGKLGALGAEQRTMAKLKNTKQPNVNARTIVVTLRLNQFEMRKLMEKAHVFTDGNQSELLRWFILSEHPTKKDTDK